jgi:hypothetical protein
MRIQDSPVSSSFGVAAVFSSAIVSVTFGVIDGAPAPALADGVGEVAGLTVSRTLFSGWLATPVLVVW